MNYDHSRYTDTDNAYQDSIEILGNENAELTDKIIRDGLPIAVDPRTYLRPTGYMILMVQGFKVEEIESITNTIRVKTLIQGARVQRRRQAPYRQLPKQQQNVPINTAVDIGNTNNESDVINQTPSTGSSNVFLDTPRSDVFSPQQGMNTMRYEYDKDPHETATQMLSIQPIQAGTSQHSPNCKRKRDPDIGTSREETENAVEESNETQKQQEKRVAIDMNNNDMMKATDMNETTKEQEMQRQTQGETIMNESSDNTGDETLGENEKLIIKSLMNIEVVQETVNEILYGTAETAAMINIAEQMDEQHVVSGQDTV